MDRVMKNVAPRSRTLGILVGAVAFAAVPGLLRADAFVRQNGSRTNDVKIVEAKWDGIRYEQSGGVRTVDGSEIVSVERDSRLLADARRAYGSGDYQKAYQEFKKARESATGWEKAEATYFMAKTLLDGGSDQASDAFKVYLDEFQDAKDWWVPYATYGRGEAELKQGRGNTANELFSRVESFGPVWKLRAKIGQGRALHAASKYLEARRAFDTVANDRSAPAFLRHQAIAGRAEAMVAQEQYDNAIKELEDGFFKTLRPDEVAYDRARAHATLLMGLAYKGLGKKQDLEWAEIWLLKVVALYGTYPDLVGQASATLADVYDALGNKERATEWRARAKA